MSSSILKTPSELLQAVRHTLAAHLVHINVCVLGELNSALGPATVLIEPVSMLSTAGRAPDGRYAHDMGIALHVVIGSRRIKAVREAADLAAAVQQQVDDNCWGLPRGQIHPPRNLRAQRRHFVYQQTRHVAWRVLFFQVIHLGAPLYEDPVVGGSAMIAEPSRVDINDPGQYTLLGAGRYA